MHCPLFHSLQNSEPGCIEMEQRHYHSNDKNKGCGRSRGERRREASTSYCCSSSSTLFRHLFLCHLTLSFTHSLNRDPSTASILTKEPAWLTQAG